MSRLPKEIERQKRATDRQIERIKLQGIGALQTEHEIQSLIVEHLRKVRRCEVLETFNGLHGRVAAMAREKGMKVGHKATKGVPDLLVSKPSWVKGCWLGLELKKAKGVLSPEQAELHRCGRIVIVRSIEEADLALAEFERAMKGQGGT